MNFVRIIIVMLLPFITNAQGQEYTINDIPLKWSDFKKTSTNMGRNAVALTYMGIQLEQEAITKNDIIELTLTLSIKQDNQKSWVSKQFLFSKNDSTTQAVLHHERLHFVLNMINFNSLFQTFDTTAFTTDYKAQIANIMNLYKLENEMDNKSYDIETLHGTKAVEQKVWEAKTLEKLNLLYPNKASFDYSYTIKKRITTK